MYTHKSTTMQELVSNINAINDSNFSRQAFDSKDINIPVKFYESLFYQIKDLHNKSLSSNNEDTLLGIDGVYNTPLDRKPMLNLGVFDISNNVPIDVTYLGNQNRNKETKAFVSYVKKISINLIMSYLSPIEDILNMIY